MKVRFWGVRGSIPTPGPDTVRYGGDTTCIEVRAGNELIIIDAGSGIRRLGLHLMKAAHGQPLRIHLLMTHTHWDHIQGFPFFIPAFCPNNTLFIYGCGSVNKTTEQILAGQMQCEYFPVTMKQMLAEKRFIRISEQPFTIGEVNVQPMYTNHPEKALAFRLEYRDSVVVFTGDHEPYDLVLSKAAETYCVEGKPCVPGTPTFIDSLDDKLARFASGADALIFDAAYTYESYKAGKRGYGHSYPEYAVKIAAKAGVKQLILTHYDPLETDDDIDAKIRHTRQFVEDLGVDVVCYGARAGLEIEV